MYLLPEGSRVNGLWQGWWCLLVSSGDSMETSHFCDVTDVLCGFNHLL